jgi:branched-chain amino acid transport system substrate-binding protein
MVSSRQRKLVAAVAALAVVVAGCSNSITTNSSGGGAPGVMSNEIDVGSIADVTGPLSSDFAPVVAGVQAYFSMVNAEGGVAGRTLRLTRQTDDQGSPTIDLSVAQTLVEQDKVFAVVGVGTPFFGGAAYLAHKGTPTFGYVVSTDWANKPALFGTFGSVLDFGTAVSGDAASAVVLGG